MKKRFAKADLFFVSKKRENKRIEKMTTGT
jgi:hypothetical protein